MSVFTPLVYKQRNPAGPRSFSLKSLCVGVSANVSPVASGEVEDDGNLGHSESTSSVGGQYLEH